MKNTKEKNANTEYTRSYTNLRGMNPTDRQSDSFFYLENMYVDYEGGGDAVESVPGFRKILSAGEKIHSFAISGTSDSKGALLIHAGKHLYRLSVSERDSHKRLSQVGELADAESNIFTFGNLTFVADGISLWLISPEGQMRKISDDSVISSCTKAALYDGRLFLSGSSALPSQVFYSTPLSEENISFFPDAFFKESNAGVAVTDILSYEGALWIFKTKDDGEGSIVCRKKSVKEKDYPIVRVFSRVSPKSRAVIFNQKIHFLGEGGLLAIEKPYCENDAEIVSLSDPIFSMLCKENFQRADLGIWLGYLAVAFGERIYLADPRGKNGGYDWYFINGVGEYKNDSRVYRYLSHAEESFDLHPHPDSVAGGEIISFTLPDEKAIFYSKEGNRRYRVYPTEELTGGDFSPAESFFFDEKFLWFATGESLYLFNNDKRGALPDSPSEENPYEEEKKLHENKIHQSFYSFAGHAPKYIAATHYDDCGLPCYEKSSAPDSLYLELCPFGESLFTLSVMTDGVRKSSFEISPSPIDFSALDFQHIGMHRGEGRDMRLSEKAVGWYKKQLVLSGNGFSSPFGIKSVSYRYRIKGASKKS